MWRKRNHSNHIFKENRSENKLLHTFDINKTDEESRACESGGERASERERESEMEIDGERHGDPKEGKTSGKPGRE